MIRPRLSPLVIFGIVVGTVVPARAAPPVAPVPRVEAPPTWPRGCAEAHDVLVPVFVDVDEAGRVTGASVEAGVGGGFDEAALAAARRWGFAPATREGVAVAARLRVFIRFSAAAEKRCEAPGAAALVGAGAVPSGAPPSPLVPPGGSASPAPSTPGTPAASTPPGAGEVVVTGQRATPAAASSVVRDAAVLHAAPHQTADDMLLVVPGVALVHHGGEGDASQIFFRGFDAQHGQDLEIWAGGAPVNDVSNIHGQGYADLHFLPPEVVRRVTSTPGPYEPQQGDFAVAGSLSFDLGYDEPGVTAKASVGQYGSRRYFLAYRPKGADEQTFAAFEVYSTDGFGPARAARRVSGVAQADYPLSGAAVVRAMVSTYAASYSSAGVLRLSDIDSGRVDRFATYDPNQGGDASRSQLVVEVRDASQDARWSFAPYVVLHSVRLLQDFTGYYVEPVPGTGGAATATASQSGNSEQEINDASTIGARANYRAPLRVFDPGDALEAGMSARYDRVSQSQKRLAIGTERVTLDEVDAKVQATDVAGYLDAALHPLRRVTLRAGVRVDGLEYVTQDNGGVGQGQRRSAAGAHLGKKATLDVLVARGLSALASYGEGFRSPQARSLASNQTTPFTSVVSSEVGVRYHEGHLRGSAAAFYTTLSDDLAFDQATARNERTPATRRKGLAVEYTAEVAPVFVSSASVTYTRAEFSGTDGGYFAGDLVPYVPQLVARSDIAYAPSLGHLLDRELRGHVGVGLTYLGQRPLPYGELGHDIFLADATASVRLREVQLGLDVFNLLDAHWFDGEYTYASNFTQGAAPSLVPQRHVTVGAPRTVFATLSIFL